MSTLYDTERQPPAGSLTIDNAGSWSAATTDTRSTKSSKKSQKIHTAILSKATTHAMVAASSIIGAGGDEQSAIDTAKAAALAVLVQADGGSSSRGFLSRRKAKQQAEIIAGMAYLSVAQQMQQEQMIAASTPQEQTTSMNPFWFNPLQQQPPAFVRQQSEMSKAVSSIGTSSYAPSSTIHNRPERFTPSLPTVHDAASTEAGLLSPPPPPTSDPPKKMASPRGGFWKKKDDSETPKTNTTDTVDPLLSNSESNDTYGDETVNKIYEEDPFLQALTSVFTCGLSDPKASPRKRHANPMSVTSDASYTIDDTTIDQTTIGHTTQYSEDFRDDEEEGFKIGSHSTTDSQDVLRQLHGSFSSESDGRETKRGLAFWRQNKEAAKAARHKKKEPMRDTVMQALSGGAGCSPRSDLDNEYYSDMHTSSPHILRVTGYSDMKTTTPTHNRFQRWKNMRKQRRKQQQE